MCIHQVFLPWLFIEDKMKLWKYNDLDGDKIVSEQEIIAFYFPYWEDHMYKVGKGDMVDVDLCIEDWSFVHWAWKIDLTDPRTYGII